MTKRSDDKDADVGGSGGGVSEWLTSVWQEIRYSLRTLRKNPGFTLAALAILALGIGANTTIFTVVNAVLLRPLPYPDADRIMMVTRSFGADTINAANMPKFVFWRENNRSFQSLAAYRSMGSGVNLAGGSEPEYVPGLRVSSDFFSVLNVEPGLGRSFTREEDKDGGQQVVVLSDALWRRTFAADPGLIGKAISLNDVSYSVVGIMPESFRFAIPADVIIPLRASATGDKGNNCWVLGRLADGVTREQAAVEMNLIAERFRAANPDMMSNEESAGVLPYQESLTAKAHPLLMILFGAVGLIQLIACANVASLQLARSAARRKQIGIRMALGASWRRIVRQLLTESVVLSFLGGAVGLLLASRGVPLLMQFVPEGMIPRAQEIGFDKQVFLFTLGASILVGLIFGLAPAFQSARVNMSDALKEETGKASMGRGRSRFQSVMVVAQIALSFVLVVSAALLIKTFTNLRNLELGFDPNNILTFQVTLGGSRYKTSEQTLEFQRRALERIKSLPGVETAAVTNTLPLSGSFNLPIEIDGQGSEMMSVEARIVTPEYFQLMALPVKAGRAFGENDTGSSPSVVMVNEAFERKYLTDADPLSRRVIVARVLGDTTSRQIVGVTRDAKHLTIKAEPTPVMFMPVTQVPEKIMLATMTVSPTRFLVRTTVEPLSLSAAVKREVLALDPVLPMTNVRSMDQIVSRSIAPDRFNMFLLGMFAVIGLALAMIGVYATMNYSAIQRTHEIGIRMALGASSTDVLRLILKRGVVVAVIGIVIGLGGAFALAPLIRNLLFGVGATDPVTLAIVAAVLATATLLACFIPARRATKVDPIIALRNE